MFGMCELTEHLEMDSCVPEKFGSEEAHFDVLVDRELGRHCACRQHRCASNFQPIGEFLIELEKTGQN